MTHIGNTTRCAIENLISYAHADHGFPDIDLAWLKGLGIVPDASKAKQVRLMVDGQYVRPAPEVPRDWRHVMTGDGVGVVAHQSQFQGRARR